MESGRAPKGTKYEPNKMISRKPPEHQFMKQFREFHPQAGNNLSVIIVYQSGKTLGPAKFQKSNKVHHRKPMLQSSLL